MSKCVPGRKDHADDADVRKHIEADEKELSSVKPKRQTPETTQQDTGEILDVRWRTTQGINIGINNIPSAAENYEEKFQKREHIWSLKTHAK